MKINEVEEQLQITRANVRYYEKEGLLHPKRSANGYRDYSEEDIIRLKKIIIFRKLGLSIAEIQGILEGTLSLSETVTQNIEKLNRQLDELSGALQICKVIQSDPMAETAFDEEHYWQLIHTTEENGQKFVEFARDYLAFGKRTLLRMWCIAFLCDLRDTVNQRDWKITLGVLFGICIVRGLAGQFLWKTGSFLYGFLYPFWLFLHLSAITLPMFVLEHRYKDVHLPEETVHKASSGRHPMLKVVVFMLVYHFLLLAGIPHLIGKLVDDKLYGSYPAYIITDCPYLIYLVVGLYLCYLILWLYSPYGILYDSLTGQDGWKAHLPAPVKRRVVLYSVFIFGICTASYTFWYSCVTEDGVTTQHFFHVTHYTWDDVDHYTLSANFGGTLKYTVTMEDGTTVTCLGDSLSYTSLPEETYPDDVDDFCRYLTEIFCDRNIALQDTDWERLNKQLTYDYWRDYTADLRAIIEGDGSTPRSKAAGN
ncbi:MAG: MerR family transcriptional regulator [Lachnospiraceae bacterium]|nr:MerR family transcriptional regulator [Lachnospiraceae bacterium]